MDELRDLFNFGVKHKGGLLNAMLMKDDEGNVYFTALFAVYVLPLIIVTGFYYMMRMPFNAGDDTVENTRILELKNSLEKAKIENWIQKHPTLRHKNRKWE